MEVIPKSLKTSYEITYKKPYTSVNFAFGEPLMARVVQRLQHFAKLEPRWVPGFSFGRSADSDEFMVALVDGSRRVVVTRDAQPISLQQFPDQSLWSSWFLSTTSRQMDFGLEEGIGEVPGGATSSTDVQASAAAGTDIAPQLPPAESCG